MQILLFGVMAIELKRRAPRCHTLLELVRKRWGNVANWVCSLPHKQNNTQNGRKSGSNASQGHLATVEPVITRPVQQCILRHCRSFDLETGPKQG